MVILSLDISSSTGWALFKEQNLINYGVIVQKHDDNSYPFGMLAWATKIVDNIVELIDNTSDIEKIIIERTNLGRQRDSQSLLESVHCILMQRVLEYGWSDKVVYIDTSQWRKTVGLKLSLEDKKQNKFIKESSKKGDKVVKQNGKRIGKVTKKHLSVRAVNNIFNLNLKLKENDISDAILLGFSYFQ